MVDKSKLINSNLDVALLTQGGGVRACVCVRACVRACELAFVVACGRACVRARACGVRNVCVRARLHARVRA